MTQNYLNSVIIGNRLIKWLDLNMWVDLSPLTDPGSKYLGKLQNPLVEFGVYYRYFKLDKSILLREFWLLLYFLQKPEKSSETPKPKFTFWKDTFCVSSVLHHCISPTLINIILTHVPWDYWEQAHSFSFILDHRLLFRNYKITYYKYIRTYRVSKS